MKRALAVVAALLVALVAFTWWALEWSGVAVIETRGPDGAARQTHVWFAEPDGELWLEAGTPENSWYADIQREPRVAFASDARSGSFRADPVLEPDGHERIRTLLRHKYGLRDWWIGVLFDTSRSVAVRLVPEPR